MTWDQHFTSSFQLKITWGLLLPPELIEFKLVRCAKLQNHYMNPPEEKRVQNWIRIEFRKYWWRVHIIGMKHFIISSTHYQNGSCFPTTHQTRGSKHYLWNLSKINYWLFILGEIRRPNIIYLPTYLIYLT